MARGPRRRRRVLGFVGRAGTALLGFVLVAMPAYGDAASGPTTLYVSPTGQDTTSCGSLEAPCATIETAVQNAAPGDTIIVKSGTYHGTVTVDKSLTIEAQQGAAVVLTGPGPIFQLYNPSDPAAGVSGVTISGFTFQGVTGSGYNGVITVPGYGAQDVTIENNTFTNITDEAVGDHANPGLSSGWTISNNVIDGVTGNKRSGLWLGNLTNAVISGNVIQNTTYAGIILDSAHHVQVTGNTISDVVTHGIEVGYTLPGGAYPPTAPSNDVLISGNVVTGANTSQTPDFGGVDLYPGQSGITVIGNYLENDYNGVDVRALPGAVGSGDVVTLNDVANNADAGIKNAAQGGGTLAAGENWWGCAQGPGGAGCSAASGMQSTIPWLARLSLTPANGAPSVGATAVVSVALVDSTGQETPGAPLQVALSTSPSVGAGTLAFTQGIATVPFRFTSAVAESVGVQGVVLFGGKPSGLVGSTSVSFQVPVPVQVVPPVVPPPVITPPVVPPPVTPPVPVPVPVPPVPVPSHTTVGSTGGVLVAPHGVLTLKVPAGAVPTGGTLSVVGTAPAPSHGLPPVMAPLAPVVQIAGPPLQKPAVASFRFPLAALHGLAPGRVSVFEQTASGQWVPVPSIVNGQTGEVQVFLHGSGRFTVVVNRQVFPDVTHTFWARPYIDRVLGAGLMQGFPNGKFEPQAPLTGAQAIKMIAVALGLPVATHPTALPGVPSGAWYASYVAALVQAHVVPSASPLVSLLTAPLTRGEVAVLLTQALHLKPPAVVPTLRDLSGLPPAEQAAIEAVVHAGLLGPVSPGTFDPGAVLTRAQAAEVFALMLRSLAP